MFKTPKIEHLLEIILCFNKNVSICFKECAREPNSENRNLLAISTANLDSIRITVLVASTQVRK
jgi:hypothetical protein